MNIVNTNKLFILIFFILSFFTTTNLEAKKLSIQLMTKEELIYNKCVYTRSGVPTHIAKKNNDHAWDQMSVCETYTKIPSDGDLAEPEKPQKKLSVALMTEEELIYNQCTNRDGTPAVIAKKNLNDGMNGSWDLWTTCKTYTKIPSDGDLVEPEKPQKKLSVELMTEEELIYNKCINKRTLTPTHISKKQNDWSWNTHSTCETYTKIPSESDNTFASNQNQLKKDDSKQEQSSNDQEQIINYKKIEDEKKIIAEKKAAAEEKQRLAKIEEEKKIIAEKKAAAEERKRLADKKIEEEKQRLAKIEEEKKKIAKIQEQIENQKLIESNNTKKNFSKKKSNSGNFLEAIAKKEIVANNKKKIIRYECQQPWDVSTEDYRPLLDIYELDLKDRVLRGTHRYITDKEYIDERVYPVLATDEDRVLVRYDSPNGNFSTKFFFNYGTDQSIVATDNSYKTNSKCVNRDYFVDIKVKEKSIANSDISKNDIKILELAKKEADLAQKEIEKIEKEQKELLAKQNSILKNQKQEPAKVAKLKVYDDPKKLNIALASSISKSQLKKYNATSAVSYLFFESSENYLISLELLYRAYDLNVEADKIRSHLGYIKDSRSSEKNRLRSTRQIVKNQSLLIRNNIKNESLSLSEQGKVYYAQSLPYALNAAISTYNLYHAATNVIKNVGKDGDIVVGILNDLNNIMGIAQILPELPSYSKNMYQTTKLIISMAKVKKIKESTNINKALNELNLET